MRQPYILALSLTFLLVFASQCLMAQNVGINTTNPQNTLHIREDDTSPVALQYTNQALTDIAAFKQNTSTNGQSVNASSAGPWVGNPDAANAPGGSYFEGPSTSTQPSDYLHISFIFNNQLPLDATITGFQATVSRRTDGSSGITDETIQLILGGSPVGDNKATSAPWPQFGFGQASYGGSNDLWNTTTISPSSINSGILKLRIQFNSPVFSTASARVDYVFMRVYYTIPGESTTHWVSGSVDGAFKINPSQDLTSSGPFKINDSGNTELQGLIIQTNASIGKVLTSDATGNASWQDLPSDMVDDADADPMNEIQDLNLNSNILEITGGSSADLSVFMDNTDDWSNGTGTIFYDSGKVGIGHNAPSYQLDIEDESHTGAITSIINTSTDVNAGGLTIGLGPQSAPAATNSYMSFLSGDGSLMGSISGNASGNISFNTTSDKRLKTNVRNYDNGLNTTLKINPVVYEMISSPGKEQVGFIAQELYNILPSSVVGTPDNPVDKPMMVDYSKLTPVLVSAIKEQQAIIEDLNQYQAILKEEVEVLKNQMKALMDRTAAIEGNQ